MQNNKTGFKKSCQQYSIGAGGTRKSLKVPSSPNHSKSSQSIGIAKFLEITRYFQTSNQPVLYLCAKAVGESASCGDEFAEVSKSLVRMWNESKLIS